MEEYNKRVREIGLKYGSLSGGFVSKKQYNKIIQFESSLEKDYISKLEFDKSVASYLEQPLTIKYRNSNGKTRKYTPDFLVRYKDIERNDEIVEIKYNKSLSENFFLFQQKFDACRHYCENNSLTFSILTEKEIRFGQGIYLSNINFLLAHRNLFSSRRSKTDTIRDLDICSLILQKLYFNNHISVEHILDLLSPNFADRNSNLFYVWYLLANNYISCDLNIKITLKTIIWDSCN